MKTVIYGASDDLIEVEGAVSEEFNCYGLDDSSDPAWIACSDGTLLKATYDGQWRLALFAKGSAAFSKDEAIGEEGSRPDGKPAYSDIVTLNGDVRWVVLGKQLAKEPVGRTFSRNMAKPEAGSAS